MRTFKEWMEDFEERDPDWWKPEEERVRDRDRQMPDVNMPSRRRSSPINWIKSGMHQQKAGNPRGSFKHPTTGEIWMLKQTGKDQGFQWEVWKKSDPLNSQLIKGGNQQAIDWIINQS